MVNSYCNRGIMEIFSIIDKVSSSIEQLQLRNYVNNYNLLALKARKAQYKVVFNESHDTFGSTKKIDVGTFDLDDLILESMEISSRNKRYINMLNARLELTSSVQTRIFPPFNIKQSRKGESSKLCSSRDLAFVTRTSSLMKDSK